MRRARTPTHAGGAIGWLAVLLSLVVVVAACGNDDDAESGDTEPTDGPAAAENGADAPEDTDGPIVGDDEVPDAIADLASETGSATVTIGDETFEFSLAGTKTVDGTTYVGRCQTLFGMIIASGFVADDRDITVDMEVPPVDWETYEDDRFDPPAVEVEDNENNADWIADVGVEFATGSGVGEFVQEGATASGSAIFVNQWDPDSDPVEGTFEVDCEA